MWGASLPASDASHATGPNAVVFGCAGPRLSADERAFFADANPLGFILFARNCLEPTQIRDLTGELRDAVGHADAPILIDQEGGRIQRLNPPHWRAAPTAASLGALAARDRVAAREAVRINAQLLGAELIALGIDVDCAPVLDVPVPGAHGIIGDRAFGTDPSLIGALGRASCEGFLSVGVAPVIKHIPGHGRARADSHLELPVVETPLDALAETDFVPFAANADAPYAMTAHVVFTALDPELPATLSEIVVEGIIRERIGFTGFLFSDDVGMKALAGPFTERTRAALGAGCDAVLHCSGDFAEMRAIAPVVPPLTSAARERFAAARRQIAAPAPFDSAAARERLDALLTKAA
jgi:beta-N-acetylhexosaminidase